MILVCLQIPIKNSKQFLQIQEVLPKMRASQLRASGNDVPETLHVNLHVILYESYALS